MSTESKTPRTDALSKRCDSFEQFIAEFEKLELELAAERASHEESKRKQYEAEGIADDQRTDIEALLRERDALQQRLAESEKAREEAILAHKIQAGNYIKLHDAIIGDGTQTADFKDPIDIVSDLRCRLAAAESALADMTKERDEADRRAGAVERSLEHAKDSISRQQSWLYDAKKAWGVSTNVSFDVVWAECLKLKSALKAAEEALRKIEDYPQQPIWSDNRDDAADDIVNIASDALAMIDEDKPKQEPKVIGRWLGNTDQPPSHDPA